MPLLSAKVLIPVAVVVVVWGGAHLLTSRDYTVSPGSWPSLTAPATTAPSALPGLLPRAESPLPATSPTAGSVPVLPGALRQLNGDTRDTAIGLYAVIQQLEAALRGSLERLVQQLEPGR